LRELALAILVATVSACGGGSASAPAIGDQCLVGSWTATSYQATFPAGAIVLDVAMSVSGGEGLMVTYSADGTETDDYAHVAPLKASGGSHTAQFQLSGVAHFKMRAKDNGWTQSGPEQSLAESIVIDGGAQVQDTNTFPGGHGTYKCSGSDLTMVAQSPVASTQTLKRA
jgi:hypothetical protein